ncbi:hypothetical protein LDENG_00137720 [Lucifuga dentata]|nr:hypothetical protein LDENG_00137720 [Lucifuga dentata]
MSVLGKVDTRSTGSGPATMSNCTGERAQNRTEKRCPILTKNTDNEILGLQASQGKEGNSLQESESGVLSRLSYRGPQMAETVPSGWTAAVEHGAPAWHHPTGEASGHIQGADTREFINKEFINKIKGDKC